ncbi:DUF2845 domain-containing protein [Pseudomonas toyotomiensis]|jgi:hypothetical protein|uniref:DUF2845 domain-containing protein n=1 Tax=Ectopseudomonas toyotomiensis TaxID=554344 RepID=A0AA42IS83_9GAMM|nr:MULTISPECIES: DUF2845 domain-containing protein [Pseudomonas]MDH0704533.1 DUF2845 domain-containing protein [Pseudomonas toyotomiensis]
MANRYLLGCLLALFMLPAAQASMRCGNALINEGELTVDVLRKCGEPDQREMIPPSSPQGGGVTVEQWVYGPRNGVYRYLRFLDGKLVEIRVARG